jgi:hypothetical protein
MGTTEAMKHLYKDGGGGLAGMRRFYRGVGPALLQVRRESARSLARASFRGERDARRLPRIAGAAGALRRHGGQRGHAGAAGRLRVHKVAARRRENRRARARSLARFRTKAPLARAHMC